MIPQIFFFLVIGYAILYLFNVAGRLDNAYKITADAKIDDLQTQIHAEIDKAYDNASEEYKQLKRMMLAFRWSRDLSYLVQLANQPSVEQNPDLQKRAYALIGLVA